ncbi:hypothetical protein V499_01802 [Pseudogymnoascus sp. VKM F-103]|nr:hypothetical protein V499_01802 [Pseudogymnoascus sp. VKM F-103]
MCREKGSAGGDAGAAVVGDSVVEGGTLVGRDEEGGDEVEGKGDFVVEAEQGVAEHIFVGTEAAGDEELAGVADECEEALRGGEEEGGDAEEEEDEMEIFDKAAAAEEAAVGCA